jgi:thiamine pyrophosphate-dependent acetolactate synthase large subunit-like protein
MSSLPIYEMLAQAFASEGVDTVFSLMGDGNMHWATAMSKIDGMRVFHARHEHCACGMAMGYYSATGKVGVATVTCGPGITQIVTALTTASRAGVPMVVFAGETPINAKWYNQALDQAPVVTATGAHYVRAHSTARMYDSVREAFYVARHERRPAVLGVPYDLQKLPLPGSPEYVPSSSFAPDTGRTPPNPNMLGRLVARLAGAQRPIIIAGRGAVRSGAQAAIEELAEACGALLATTLPARGMFDHNPYSIGVAGGFSTEIARELFAESDLVIAVGASLTYYTVDGGALFPKAFVAQIDERPRGLKDGMRAADLFVRADAKVGAEAAARELVRAGAKAGFRSPKLAQRIALAAPDTAQFSIAPGTFDPRQVTAALDRVIPKDWEMVSGSGHSAYFQTHMRGRRPEQFHVLREFGAIGNSISIAIGVAAAKNNGKVVLIEGDGSLIMHIQELETLKRHGLRLLICVLNDGAYGAEVHKLRQDGLDDSGAIFGRTDFGSIARGFGLRGTTVADLGHLAALIRDYDAQGTAENLECADFRSGHFANHATAQGQGTWRDVGRNRKIGTRVRQGTSAAKQSFGKTRLSYH